nr:YbaB/EbfC family nucleoid-associated protein [Mycobacteroides chelonae]
MQVDFDSAVDVDAARRVGDWLADAVEKITGVARVGERAVTGGVGKVTVSAQGRLLRLDLSPQSLQPRADRLAAWIEAAYVQACESAVAQVREQIKRVTDANPEFSDMFEQLDADFGKLSTTLRAPKPRAEREFEEQDLGPGWEQQEWDPGADPFGYRRR